MFVEPARAKEFECALCLDVYTDPVQIGCEDHIYCKQCINELISANGDSFQCPLCKVECDADDVTRVKFVARQVGALQVKCPNTIANKEFIGTQKNDNGLRRSTRLKEKIDTKIGNKRRRSFDNENEDNSNHNKRRKLNVNELCEWTGSYSDLKNHIKICTIQLITCRFCLASILQKELEEHETKCPMFPLKCIKCGEEDIAREDMEKHVSESCPMTLINCNECKQEITRDNKRFHLKHECPESLIQCVFYKFGCKDKLKRKDEKKHIENATFTHSHLVQISNHQVKLQKTVTELKKDVKSLKKKINGLENMQNQSNNKMVQQINILKSKQNQSDNKMLQQINILNSKQDQSEKRMIGEMAKLPQHFGNARLVYVKNESGQLAAYNKNSHTYDVSGVKILEGLPQ